MSRKRTVRRQVVALPPRAFRKKLSADQVRDLSLAHHQNLDAIAKGEADEAILWQQVGGTMTWCRVATLLGLGEPEMAIQLNLMVSLVARFRDTGQVRFEGAEYQHAREGVLVMDELAASVDAPTAVQAAEWGEQQMKSLANCPRASASEAVIA